MQHITISQAQAISNSPIFQMKLPVATGYKFSKLAKLLQPELATVEEERLKLILSCGGKPSEDGTVYSFDDAGKAFSESYIALLATTIDIGIHFPMPLEALGANVELTPVELLQLEPLFDVAEPAQS